jgi:general L-amino acid transport system permease protein
MTGPAREPDKTPAMARLEEPARPESALPLASRIAFGLDWPRRHLFNSIPNTILTILCLWLLWETLPALLGWALIDAVWTGTPDSCRAADGACWALITEKHRFILFGLYPYY